jgi:hypothetical protein
MISIATCNSRLYCERYLVDELCTKACDRIGVRGPLKRGMMIEGGPRSSAHASFKPSHLITVLL